MPDKISILKESGETISSNVVSVFMIPDTEKKYIITTENAVDPHGLTVLHVSEMVDGNLQKIATDEEWSSIKTIMRAMISGNVSSYQYLPTVESIKASGQYSRDISVSASASKQMIDNYVAGDKSNVAVSQQAPNPQMGMNPVNPAVQNVPPAAIFPTNGAPAMNADDELIPGIAEVDATPVDPSVLQNSMMANNNVAPTNVGGVQPMDNNPVSPMGENAVPNMMNPSPLITPINPVNPTPNPMMQQPAPTQPGMMTPVGGLDNTQIPGSVPPVVSPVAPDNNLTNGMSNEVQVPNIPGMPPLTDNVNTMTASNIQVNNGILNPTPVSVTPEPEIKIPDVPLVPETPLNPSVQVLQPSVTVPTAQIAQEAQASVPAPEVKIDTNATPSFAPDASLDEVVMAAQEMFMEGVKNLVQTIQEKVYRDLYAREAQVKEKENLLEQREKMLNDQMMAMMSNFAVMQGKPLTPPVGQPTVVEASNDVK